MVKVMMMVMVQEIAEYLQQIYLEDGLSSERLDSKASLRSKDEKHSIDNIDDNDNNDYRTRLQRGTKRCSI